MQHSLSYHLSKVLKVALEQVTTVAQTLESWHIF